MGHRVCPLAGAFVLAALLAWAPAARGQEPPPPAAKPAANPPTTNKVGKLPFLEFDARTKQVRVECEVLGVDAPLEFFAVVVNGPEHEAIVRSRVKPSDLHTALLALGLKPGAPVSYSKAAEKWLPPHGPPLHINMEYEKDGKRVTVPANRWMRDIKTKKPMPRTTWIFAGSRVMNDGNYAADSTGYLISVVNFDMTVIDIPDLASASNDTLDWERNPEMVPPAGTKVTMVIQPAGTGDAGGAGAATKPAAPAETAPQPGAAGPDSQFGGAVASAAPVGPPTAGQGAEALSDVKLDEAMLERVTKRWEGVVGPKAQALREAAQAHYDTMNALRREQQRLVDEADRVQRVIDRLEKQYQDMTTPQPEGEARVGTSVDEHAAEGR